MKVALAAPLALVLLSSFIGVSYPVFPFIYRREGAALLGRRPACG
jgi:hypothetical protein